MGSATLRERRRLPRGAHRSLPPCDDLRPSCSSPRLRGLRGLGQRLRLLALGPRSRLGLGLQEDHPRTHVEVREAELRARGKEVLVLVRGARGEGLPGLGRQGNLVSDRSKVFQSRQARASRPASHVAERSTGNTRRPQWDFRPENSRVHTHRIHTDFQMPERRPTAASSTTVRMTDTSTEWTPKAKATGWSVWSSKPARMLPLINGSVPSYRGMPSSPCETLESFRLPPTDKHETCSGKQTACIVGSSVCTVAAFILIAAIVGKYLYRTIWC